MRKGVDLAGGARPRQERGEDILAAERDRTAGEGDEPEQLVVRYPIAKARGLDLYSVPGCPGAGLSEPPFPIL